MPIDPPPAVVIDGQSAKAIQGILGRPVTRAADGPGETWTYRSGACEVRLFLFPGVANGSLYVLDHQVSGAGAGQADQQACLRQVQHGSGN